jgi:hypothetical protein
MSHYGDMKYAAGHARAMREFADDGWTPGFAARYLDECTMFGRGDGRDEYDRGYMAAVRELAAKEEA